ncbi:hypothetical protein [Bacillus toyonensis]|uniref:hypothetical protein n=1 Tax=Bacillus toyonensis TaxID=155322 RepID=UPI000BF1648B|nr:hypothetical protein [Bacillus toyonensis]PEL51067.1 hypothetical protein CN633_31450 [Bacillus toyonensis]
MAVNKDNYTQILVTFTKEQVEQIEKACFEKKFDQNTLFLYSIESSSCFFLTVPETTIKKLIRFSL